MRKFQPARVPAHFQRAQVVILYRGRGGALVGVDARGFFERPHMIERVRSYVPFTRLQTIRSDLYHYPPTDKLLTAPSLRGHILEAHINPYGFSVNGIPTFDLELLLFSGFSAWKLVEKIYEILLSDDAVLQGAIDHDARVLQVRAIHFSNSDIPSSKNIPFTVSEYRKVLIRTLLYIEQLKLEDVDWHLVESTLRAARKLGILPSRDFRDHFFLTPALCEEIPRWFIGYPATEQGKTIWDEVDARYAAYEELKKKAT